MHTPAVQINGRPERRRPIPACAAAERLCKRSNQQPAAVRANQICGNNPDFAGPTICDVTRTEIIRER